MRLIWDLLKLLNNSILNSMYKNLIGSNCVSLKIERIYNIVWRRKVFCRNYFMIFESWSSLRWSVPFALTLPCSDDCKSHLCQISTKKIILNFYFYRLYFLISALLNILSFFTNALYQVFVRFATVRSLQCVKFLWINIDAKLWMGKLQYKSLIQNISEVNLVAVYCSLWDPGMLFS